MITYWNSHPIVLMIIARFGENSLKNLHVFRRNRYEKKNSVT